MPNSILDADNLDSEERITLGLLSAVEDNAQLSQRHLARELGIALGLANTYLKRCVTKGLIKVRQVPANRYAYYLTPQGIAEKSRLAGQFLTQGFHFFRVAREQYDEVFATCVRRGWRRIALHGLTDLTEVAVLCSREFPALEIVGICDPSSAKADYQSIPVVMDLAALAPFDALVIADLGNPQREYDTLVGRVAPDRILAPALLGVRIPAGGEAHADD